VRQQGMRDAVVIQSEEGVFLRQAGDSQSGQTQLTRARETINWEQYYSDE
jgi:hypothetical protein